MNFKSINIKNSKRLITFCVLLLFLVFSYIIVSFIEAKTTFSDESKLENALKDMEICLGGEAVGIKILATGVLVMGIEDTSPLSIGDIILEINNIPIDTNDALIKEIQKSQDNDVLLKINRDGELKAVSIKPKYSETTKMYELGLWVKDSSAGVGTISFYDRKNMKFASLGHGITETANNIIIPINSGGIVKTKITEITKGERKAPGDIKGILYTDVLGQIVKNTSFGIYGILDVNMCVKKEKTDVAKKMEVVEGPAKIYCTLDDNKVHEFNVNVDRVLYNSTGNKNMVIKITDEELLNKTGGIVQGMSGSPIVQNGKLVGAITHVFYNDPTQGYGVFAETMINDMISIDENINRDK